MHELYDEKIHSNLDFGNMKTVGRESEEHERRVYEIFRIFPAIFLYSVFSVWSQSFDRSEKIHNSSFHFISLISPHNKQHNDVLITSTLFMGFQAFSLVRHRKTRKHKVKQLHGRFQSFQFCEQAKQQRKIQKKNMKKLSSHPPPFAFGFFVGCSEFRCG